MNFLRTLSWKLKLVKAIGLNTNNIISIVVVLFQCPLSIWYGACRSSTTAKTKLSQNVKRNIWKVNNEEAKSWRIKFRFSCRSSLCSALCWLPAASMHCNCVNRFLKKIEAAFILFIIFNFLLLCLYCLLTIVFECYHVFFFRHFFFYDYCCCCIRRCRFHSFDKHALKCFIHTLSQPF